MLSLIPDFDVTEDAPIKRVFCTVEVVDLVGNFPYTIGFSSMSLVRDRSVKVISLNGIKPLETEVSSGRYPLVIPFAVVHRNQPLPAKAKKFLSFLQTTAAREIISSFGAVSLMDR